ncbi:hypothetical protein CYLTODRAFT_458810 [Cylindrobasidium torrendii FP15055 ss-10]|uniref:Uncharacterized protein n=1 Tax=Cylindrobasidium torrendii FP15055 ss-10 TaxID=1314674 RepID=A0A0D7AW84_9AGAR|nr:hypothetical protein CYLTODRAFT_458810 [Cylindrobasidium torrendii FP15055 ss-10]
MQNQSVLPNASSIQQGGTGAAPLPAHWQGVAHRHLPSAQARRWPTFEEAIRTDWPASGSTNQLRIYLHKQKIERERAKDSATQKGDDMWFRILAARAHCERRIRRLALKSRIPHRKIKELKMKMKMYDEVLDKMHGEHSRMWKPIVFKEPAFSKIRSSKLRNEIV